MLATPGELWSSSAPGLSGHAPDLLNGHLVCRGATNHWRTEIQAALLVGDEFAYLGHECRSERIPALSKKPNRIFRARTYEYVVARSRDNAIAFRSGGALYPLFPSRRKGIKPVELLALESEAHCDLVPVRFHDLETVLAALQENADSPGRLFMEVTFNLDGRECRLYTPCRNINYSPIGSAPLYVQPIAGQILLLHNGQFSIGYVACSMRPGQPDLIEVAARGPVSLLDIKPKGAFSAGVLKALRVTGLHRAFLVDEYVNTVKLDGTCRLYSY